jgi:hypothetical protein
VVVGLWLWSSPGSVVVGAGCVVVVDASTVVVVVPRSSPGSVVVERGSGGSVTSLGRVLGPGPSEATVDPAAVDAEPGPWDADVSWADGRPADGRTWRGAGAATW